MRRDRRVTARGVCFAACGVVLALLATGASEPEPPEAELEAPGPVLRSALTALAAAQPERALALLGQGAERWPDLADHVERLQVRALLAADRAPDAAALAAGFADRHPHSWLRANVAHLEGDALAAVGDWAAAASAWRRASGALQTDSERAVVAGKLAVAQEAAGQLPEAAASYRKLWLDYPESPQAQEAEQALARLEAAEVSAPRRAADYRARCEALRDARQNDWALAACDAGLALDPAAAERASLAETRAHLLFRMRRYPEAVEAFEALGDGRTPRLWHARSLARSGNIDASIAAFEALGAKPETTLGARALFLVATLYEDRDATTAEQHFASVAKSAPDASQRAAARWRLGWAAFRDGRHETALRQFQRLEREERDPIERLRARYWHARTLERLGRGEEGSAQVVELASEYPLSYYGWRAGARVDPPAAEADPADTADGSGLPEAPVARIRVLLEAGLREEALHEIRSLAKGSGRREQRAALADLYARADAFHQVQQLALDAGVLALAQGPGAADPELLRQAWPTAYAPTVEYVASRHGVAPELVYAIMREESGYRPAVISVVGARGLVQIMPTTGERLSAALGFPRFDPEQLFDPTLNLELGAYYLAQLLQRFEGRLSAAIAAYNAGPNAVEEWLGARGELADDEWVETIPYDQTRSYVKRVLRSVHAYQVLH